MRKKYTDVVIGQDSGLRQIGPKIKYRLFKSRPYFSGPSSILKLNTLISKKIPFLVRKGFHQKAYFWRNSRIFFKNCSSNKNDGGLKETSTFAIMSYHPSKDFSDLYLSLLEQYRNLAFGRAVQFFFCYHYTFCSLHFFLQVLLHLWVLLVLCSTFPDLHLWWDFCILWKTQFHFFYVY